MDGSTSAFQLTSGEARDDSPRWSPDGRALAFLSDRAERGTKALYRIAVDGGEAIPLVKRRKKGIENFECDGGPQSSYTIFAMEPDANDAPADGVLALAEPRGVGPGVHEPVCAVGLRHVPGTQQMVIGVAEGLTTRLEWLEPSTGVRETLHVFPEGDIGPFAVGMRDGVPVVAAVQSAGDKPPELYVGRPGRLLSVSDHHAALARYIFGTQEPFYWTAPDGLALDGLLIRPPDASAGPLPTVVLVHGGPYERWSNGFHLSPWDWAQWIALHGYAVLLPNCRGGMGHGHSFAALVRGDVGGADYGDIMAAVDVAITLGIADPEHLGIGGWSQGGFMTAWALTQTDRFKAGVMGAGVSDWGMLMMTSDLPSFEATLGGTRPWDGPGAAPFRSPFTDLLCKKRSDTTTHLAWQG